MAVEEWNGIVMARRGWSREPPDVNTEMRAALEKRLRGVDRFYNRVFVLTFILLLVVGVVYAGTF